MFVFRYLTISRCKNYFPDYAAPPCTVSEKTDWWLLHSKTISMKLLAIVVCPEGRPLFPTPGDLRKAGVSDGEEMNS